MIINFNKKSKFKLSDRICFKLFSPQTEILEFAGDIVFYPILFKFLEKTESDCQTKSAIALKFKEMKKDIYHTGTGKYEWFTMRPVILRESGREGVCRADRMP